MSSSMAVVWLCGLVACMPPTIVAFQQRPIPVRRSTGVGCGRAPKAIMRPFRRLQRSLTLLHKSQSRIRGISNGRSCGYLLLSALHASFQRPASSTSLPTLARGHRVGCFPTDHEIPLQCHCPMRLEFPHIFARLMHRQQCDGGTLAPLSI